MNSLVDIWGSDHHGYVPRVKAGMDALGYAPDKLRVMLVQFVNLIRDGKENFHVNPVWRICNA